MSTKLYNGLVLAEHAPDLQNVTRIVSKRLREVFNELSMPIVAQYVASIIDQESKRTQEMAGHLGSRLIHRARQLWVDTQNAEDPAFSSHDPLRFSMVFGEASDATGTRRLAYFFSGNRAYEKALLEIATEHGPIFHDYHYQNQADQPDDVTEAEWERRRLDWDQLLNSDDEETNGTFGHLPMWELPNTISDVFKSALLGYGTIDLNEQVTIEQRLRLALVNAVSSKLPRLTEDEGICEALERHRAVEKAVASFLDSEPGQLMPRPPALPQNLWMAIDDLPPVYVPEAVYVDTILELTSSDK